MENFFAQIFALLTNAPGNLIYHLVLAFSVAGALQGSLVYRQGPHRLAARHTLTGLILLLAAQFTLFITSGLAWQGFGSPTALLPPLDRAVTAFSLVWLIWLWGFTEPRRWASTLAAGLSVLIGLGFALTLTIWQSAGPEASFNGSWLDDYWLYTSIGLNLLGMMLFIYRRPVGWGIGISALVLLAGGLIAHLVIAPTAGNFSGAIRLAQVAAYPLLLALPLRLTQSLSEELHSAPMPAPSQTNPAVDRRQPVQEPRRYSADPKTALAFLTLASEEELSQIVSGVTRSIGQAMLADLSLWLSFPEHSDQVIVEGGYDLIREEAQPGCIILKSRLSFIVSSLQRGKSLRLAAEPMASPDMITLAETFGFGNPGNLLAAPILDANKVVLGGLILLTPYSSKMWSADDQTYLTHAANKVAYILQRCYTAAHQKHELAEVHQQLQGQAASDSFQENTRVSGQPSLETQEEVQALLAVQKDSTELLDLLKAENDQLRTALENMAEATREKDDVEIQLETELRSALVQVDEMQNALAIANDRIQQLEQGRQQNGPISSSEYEKAWLLLRELHQPFATLLNNVDLLLNNLDNGDPAEPSRRLEKVKTGADHIHALLTDLDRIATSEGPPEPSGQTGGLMADLSNIIDSTFSSLRSDLRKKAIALRIDLPGKLPRISIDPEALQQILLNLLQNACQSTPNEGSLHFRVRIEAQESGQKYLLIQVTDMGGGVNPAELEQLYNASQLKEVAQVAGVGFPAGIYLTHKLVEAHQGRMWADVDDGKSSTFSVRLPVSEPVSILEGRPT